MGRRREAAGVRARSQVGRGDPERATDREVSVVAAVVALVQPVIALIVAFGLALAPDQIGAILAVTAVVLGLITRSRVSPV